jgi:bifunctional DNA-binding transcriptional regulator/antitoxin component of YhaV-PrlF toxin-antitoxin module
VSGILLAATRLSSKRQIVIPEEIGDSLGLKTGVRFVIIGKGDSAALAGKMSISGDRHPVAEE